MTDNTPASEAPTSLHTADLIRTHIEAKPDKEYGSWRASAMGKCPRAHFLLRAGVKPTIPKTDITLRKFKAGDIFHDFIQDITIEEVEKLGGKAVKEQELFDEELDLGGRYDLLIDLDGRRILKDIKSQHSGFFHKLGKEAQAILEKPSNEAAPEERQRAMKEAFWKKYPHQVIQLGAYMVLLKRQGTPVNEGVIVRVSKDDLSLAEVHFKLTPALEKLVLNELDLLNKHWKEQTLPPCRCGNNDWETRFCDYGDPDSEEYVQVPDRNYKRKQVTRCCGEDLWTTKQ